MQHNTLETIGTILTILVMAAFFYLAWIIL